ncbi:MAG: hypothetical protein RI943_850 [Bacteroidota bacterium]|jgi:hypothetical protein
MSIKLFFLSFLFAPFTMAQTTFSISPLVNHKLLFNGFSRVENQIQAVNPYFNFYPKLISNRPSINIGLRLTMNFKNDGHLLMCEWSQDAMGTMSKTTTLGTSNTYGLPEPAFKTYSIGTSYFQSGFVFDRFSLFYGRKLTKDKSLQKVWMLFDFSFAKSFDNQAEWKYENFPENNSVYYHNNATFLSKEIKAYSIKGIYALLGFGLMTDFSIRLKKKNLYLFTAEAQYRQGFKTMGFSTETTLINDTGETIAFLNSISSKGSGVYFQISRKFQLYPLNVKQKK